MKHLWNNMGSGRLTLDNCRTNVWQVCSRKVEKLLYIYNFLPDREISSTLKAVEKKLPVQLAELEHTQYWVCIDEKTILEVNFSGRILFCYIAGFYTAWWIVPLTIYSECTSNFSFYKIIEADKKVHSPGTQKPPEANYSAFMGLNSQMK